MMQRRQGRRRGNRFPAIAAVALGLVILLAGVMLGVRAHLAGASSGSGARWQADGLAGDTVHYLALAHAHVGIAFAATESGVYRRAPDGTWTRVLAQSGVWTVALLPDDRTVLAGDQMGRVYLSMDGGTHWGAASVTHDAVYAATFVGGSRGNILAGAGGGVFQSRNGGANWHRVLRLHDSAIAAFTSEPGSSRTIFAGAVASSAAGATGVYVSRDGGASWKLYGHHPPSGGGIMSLAALPGKRLLAGTMGHAIWSATGASSAWRRASSGMPVSNDHVAGIAVLPGTPRRLFAGTLGAGVFESRDGGRHWSAMSDGLRGSTDAMIVLSLAYSPVSRTLYAGTSVGVYAFSLKSMAHSAVRS